LATSTQTLDFEKPIVELERQIDELKQRIQGVEETFKQVRSGAAPGALKSKAQLGPD